LLQKRHETYRQKRKGRLPSPKKGIRTAANLKEVSVEILKGFESSLVSLFLKCRSQLRSCTWHPNKQIDCGRAKRGNHRSSYWKPCCGSSSIAQESLALAWIRLGQRGLSHGCAKQQARRFFQKAMEVSGPNIQLLIPTTMPWELWNTHKVLYIAQATYDDPQARRCVLYCTSRPYYEPSIASQFGRLVCTNVNYS
jgi:hypothetical protein